MVESDIFLAVKTKDIDQLRAIEKDSLNSLNEDGQTPLMVAVKQEYVEGVKALLQLGADASISQKNGTTAAEQAKAIGNQDVIEALNSQLEDLSISKKQEEQSTLGSSAPVVDSEASQQGTSSQEQSKPEPPTKDTPPLKFTLNPHAASFVPAAPAAPPGIAPPGQPPRDARPPGIAPHPDHPHHHRVDIVSPEDYYEAQGSRKWTDEDYEMMMQFSLEQELEMANMDPTQMDQIAAEQEEVAKEIERMMANGELQQ